MSRVWVVTAFATISVLVGLSGWLAGRRIYQVDECQNVYVARLLSSGRAESSFTSVSLYLAPLAWIGRGATTSVEVFSDARRFALGIFWLNVVLLAVATGERLWSWRGLAALVGAATLAPMWDYGFEVRHDNLLLTGLLSMWCVLRVFPRGTQSYVAAGAIAVALEFVAFKAFIYVLPLLVASLVWPPPPHQTNRAKLTAACLAGALVMFLVIRAGYGTAGWWDLYLRDLRGLSQTAAHAARFGPLPALRRLCGQAPLLIVAVPAAVIWLREGARRYGVPALSWNGVLPEVLLLGVALIALSINPSPYPYNLVNVVPFAFLLAFRLLSTLSRQFSSHAKVPTAAWICVVVAHILPFVVATQRHAGMRNDRQRALMQASEDLTDSTADPVYDGIGMVPTRRSIGYHWFLHSLYLDRFRTVRDLRLSTMLSATPAAVIIPSYRTDWLPPDDHAFIRSRYIPLADDLWVLGGVLRPGGGTARIVHPGRYRLVRMEPRGDDLASVQEALRQDRARLISPIRPGIAVDGREVTDRVVELTTGAHEITCPTGCRPGYVWLGPRLADIPSISGGDHRALFVNWY